MDKSHMTEKYNLPMRIMHTIVALLIITLLAVGVYMANFASDIQSASLYPMHKAFGVIALGFIALRIIIRLCSKIPGKPAEITAFDYFLASVVVLIMYIFMLTMPLSGIGASQAFGYPIEMFGWAVLPSFLQKNPELGKLLITIHKYVGFAFIGIIILHVAGSLKHLLVDKYNIFKRMM